MLRSQQRRDTGHDEERGGVDQHRHGRSPGAGDHATEQRPRGEADIPRCLEAPVGEDDAGLSRNRRDQCELGGLREREADAERGGEQEHSGGAVDEREPDRNAGLGE